MKKILLFFIAIFFMFCCIGCENKNSKNILVISSYNQSKETSSIVFEIKLQNEYNIDEDYEVIVRYGHTINSVNEEMFYNYITLLQAYHLENNGHEYLNFSKLISGERLIEIDDFLTSRYRVQFEIKKGEYKNFIYNNEIKMILPKNLIADLSGVLCISLICFHLDDSGDIESTNYFGSSIYISYKIKNNKIYFSNI